MNGILVVNKPMNMTSFDVIAILRKAVGIKRIGHTGTLDPDATGVLPVCIGKATGAVEYLIDKDKKYRVMLKLGIETDTGDASGTVISRSEVTCTENEITEAVMSFKGRTMQIPPMYSALKVNGEKLCNLARKGITVEREPREIEIYQIDILETSKDTCSFDVHCSKGTYIRTLCEDIGKKLGSGGHMESLCRVSAGKFHIEDSFTIAEIREKAAAGLLQQELVAVDKALDGLEEITLREIEGKKFLNGVFIKLDSTKYSVKNSDFLYRIYQESLFLGIGSIIIREGNVVLRSKKLFV